MSESNQPAPATIGSMIRMLEEHDDSARIWYEFSGLYVHNIYSYRGWYSDLAIGFSSYPDATDRWPTGKVYQTVGELKAVLELATRGVPFEGYKGGYFFYGYDSFLWVDTYRGYSMTSIKDIVPEPESWLRDGLIIRTQRAFRPETEDERQEKLVLSLIMRKRLI